MGTTGERRLRQRYKMGLVIRVRTFDGRGTAKWYIGRTCDMSTIGVSFRCSQALPVNVRVEMVIDWPSKKDGDHPIYVRAVGHVVRSHGRKTAVQMSLCRMVVDAAASPPKGAAASSGM